MQAGLALVGWLHCRAAAAGHAGARLHGKARAAAPLSLMALLAALAARRAAGDLRARRLARHSAAGHSAAQRGWLQRSQREEHQGYCHDPHAHKHACQAAAQREVWGERARHTVSPSARAANVQAHNAPQPPVNRAALPKPWPR